MDGMPRPYGRSDNSDAAIGVRVAQRLLQLGNWNRCTLVRTDTYSRNTVLYWIDCDGTAFIGKRYTLRPRTDIVAEFEALRRYGAMFAPPISMARELAAFDDLGVIVMHAADGVQLRQMIEMDIRSNEPTERLSQPIGLAARALALFHRDGVAEGEMSRRRRALYLDYSPRNILVAKDRQSVTLIDPPGEQRRGTPHLDLGTFCFDLSRIAFTLYRNRVAAQVRLEQLSQWFVWAYFDELGVALRERDLKLIELGERRRATNVMRWYARFHRYRTWPKELARCAIMLPQVWAYERYGIAGKYVRMHRSLEKGGRGVVPCE